MSMTIHAPAALKDFDQSFTRSIAKRYEESQRFVRLMNDPILRIQFVKQLEHKYDNDVIKPAELSE